MSQAMAVTAEPQLPPDSASPTVPAERIERRAVDALLQCIARHGLTKTTLDDVAREAGCSRATLYRYFSGKRQLVCLTVASESERVASSIRAAADAQTTLEDTVVAVLGSATRELREHSALQFILAFEPEVVLPHVTFSAGDKFLVETGAVLAPSLERYVGVDRAARAGEWLARIVLAYALCPLHPTNSIDLTDDETTRTLVREFVLPGLADRPSHTSEPTRG
jgi:AcrR family transcriptional regulator